MYFIRYLMRSKATNLFIILITNNFVLYILYILCISAVQNTSVNEYYHYKFMHKLKWIFIKNFFPIALNSCTFKYFIDMC